MKHTALVLAAVLAVPAFAGCDKAPTTARERQAGDPEIRHAGTANASVVAAFRLSSGYTLGVVASNDAGSNTTGVATVYSVTGDVSFSIDIHCISKPGNGRAKLSGTVNESSDPTIEGWDAYFEVKDGVPDQANTVNLSDGFGPTCLDSPEYDLANIASGIVIVN